MNMAVGESIRRKDAWDKVTGKAKYTDDLPTTGLLEARLFMSTCAHAKIDHIDLSAALEVNGVKTILIGKDCPLLFGPLTEDRPALARGVVRYAGEPIAMVIAQDKPAAEQAVRLIQVNYQPLPIVLTPTQALAQGAPLLHDNDSYRKTLTDIYPEPGTNIASRYRMRKGNVEEAFKGCTSVVEQRFYLPPSGHLAMEVRTARAEISADGEVLITTSSQAPYSVRKQLSETFLIESGKIRVHVPFIGGGFGGKAPVMLEILAFLASRSVGGKPVRLSIPREQDMASAPCRMGLEADIKIGADKDGLIQAAELTYRLDCGAYTDTSPYMAKAIAMDCTGPYRVDNLWCDSLCVYTNHTYVTSFRGFSHESYTFCIERTLDLLAKKYALDPFEFRLRNAIGPDCLTPSQVLCTNDLTGNLTKCLYDIRSLSNWNGGRPVTIKENTVRAKGISCFWKTENPPTDAISGALITFNPDGSLNLHTGVVEMGSNSQTHLAQMLAEKLKMSPDQVHIVYSVDTRAAPEHWKSVASLTEFMAGHAVMRAADDLVNQLRSNGSSVLNCPPEEIEVENGRVFSKKNPEQFIAFKDIVQGYKSDSGQSLGEPAIGRGGYILKGLCTLDPLTGKGKTGPEWTVGAQVVEVEADLSTLTYRIINASTVIDVGKVINPESMRAVIAGGMSMGISLSSREVFFYDQNGVPKLPNLRTYKLLHIGQEPDYRVGFVETPESYSPYGVRSFAEHGILGIPAALGNALSAAFGRQLVTLPLTPENVWRTPEGD
ncbi:MAG TPA: xanthine dehydrogenase family protein molybdopterin-binding subunit [Oscillospiraceae bacterium]|nr:xanthine dehydrogenase family protein molybdopterin-binding subunit [Oscillospiraceae bacterium]HPS34339.1 xanthine dehydrogenase family protein molybdopterin-binding subunit [Oscillospiraceae bacterium]